jgi:hypothetical protein
MKNLLYLKINDNTTMKKQFISEAKRMQKLAGIQLNEMALPEMARTAGTGGAFTITDMGEQILRQARETNSLPAGLTPRDLDILVFLFKAKRENRRVQKMDYAREKGIVQPQVNPNFNKLLGRELVSSSSYEAQPRTPSARPQRDVSDILGDLELDEAGYGGPSIDQMTRDEMIEFLGFDASEADGMTDKELRDLVVDKNADLM